MVPDRLDELMRELERFGEENDAQATNRSQKMLNITRDTGEFLLVLVRALKAKRVLEIGTSNGYSTLWLALAVQPLGGTVTSVEKSEYKRDLARTNFERSGMAGLIRHYHMDAGEFLKQQAPGAFDFIFLDSTRGEYVGWWQDLQRVLVTGGLLVIDNAVSHAHELEEFSGMIKSTPGYVTSLVPVGKGELVVLKESA